MEPLNGAKTGDLKEISPQGLLNLLMPRIISSSPARPTNLAYTSWAIR